MSNFQDKFKFISYTLHKLAPGEAKGKASNVGYCCDRMHLLMPKDINLENVFVTSMDCDSLCPKEYIDEVNAEIYLHPERASKTYFIPTQIFKQNDQEVSVLIRSHDNYHSMVHWLSVNNLLGCSLPISNYTLPYTLYKKSGFSDRGQDGIAEDSRTYEKIYLDNHGEIYSRVILVPFNQLNIDTGNGWIQNFRAKWTQNVRHGAGLNEFNYVSYRGLTSKTIHWKDLKIVLTLFQLMFLQVAVYMPLLSYTTFEPFFTSTYNERKDHFETIKNIKIALLVLSLIHCISFELYKRYCNKRFFGGKNGSLWCVW